MLQADVKRIRKLAEHFREIEQATRQNLVGLLFTISRYDLADPLECISEYRVELGPSRSIGRPFGTAIRASSSRRRSTAESRGSHMGIGSIKHVVILMQENRSFDEYFGTFPGATGFYDTSAAAIFNQPNYAGYPGGLRPFRMSSFTASGIQRPGHAHDWNSMHTFWANGNMNGWASATFGPVSAHMAFYVADDIPYHWALASNFALCDHYFASALAGTAPNRLHLMSGCIQDPANPPYVPGSGLWPGPATGNPGYPGLLTWPTYADMLSAQNVSWAVYDETGSPPSWLTSAADPTNGWGSLNILDLFNTDQSSANYKAGFGQFESDAASGKLPTVSWLIPPFGLTEWERNQPGDGAYNMALKLNAILNATDADGSPLWESTVFILTYDENDGHFDHVRPPTPTPAEEPWLDAGTSAGDGPDLGPQPIGLGFRVPAIVISPWTFGRGVQSQVFDHTSILQFLEKVTGVTCFNLPVNAWRRSALFGDLTEVFDFSNPVDAATVIAQLPTLDQVHNFKMNAENRYTQPPPNGLGYTDLGQSHVTAPLPVPPQNPTWPPVAQACQLIMTTPSFGQNQVQAQAAGSTGPVTFPDAIKVYVDGFEPSELTTPYATQPPQSIPSASPQESACSTRIPAITFTDSSGNVITNIVATPTQIDFDPSTISTLPGVPHRFTFTYSVTFNDPVATFSFTAGTVQTLSVTANFQVDAAFTSAATLELVTSDDPQFLHRFYNATPYLSLELRVFPLVAGQSIFGVTLGPGKDPSDVDGDDALTFITTVMSALTTNQGTIPGNPSFPSGEILSFDDLEQGEDQASLPLYPTDTATNYPVFNFALARVQMQADSSDSATVRVFFRSFRASSTSVAYETQYAYRQYPLEGTEDPPPTGEPPDTKIPLLGVGYGQDAGEYATIPFFATERIQISDATKPMTWQQDTPNVQPIQTGMYGVPSGGTVQAYFGCWLDINQPQTNLFPIDVPADPGQLDGPFDPGAMLPIHSAFIFDGHQCLVAEISYDPIVIPPGDTPQYSAWLAQRNLGLSTAPNPGQHSSRRVMSVFEITPTSTSLLPGLKPDEILFDWTGLPPGSTASIYLPALGADKIMATAASMYGTQPFTRTDAHTLACPAKGLTYMPVPPGSGRSFAGLLTIDLPGTIHKGQTYLVVVNQVTNAQATPVTSTPVPKIASRDGLLTTTTTTAPSSWRKISGTFQITIPIHTKKDILTDKEREYSILLWILQTIPTTNRWYPVFLRYVCEFGHIIKGLGGDPTAIPPTGTGTWPGGPGSPGKPGTPGGPGHGFEGKIEGLVYDRFGDFEGFILRTDGGRSVTFHSRESHVRDIADRAWAERLRVTVIPEPGDGHRFERIVLHPTPRPLSGE